MALGAGMVLVFLVFGLVGTVFCLWMLVDCAQHEPATVDKLVWVSIMIFTHWVGAVIYYFVRRRTRVL